MNLVRQEHPYGCGVACIAMLLGCTYAEATDAYARVYPEAGVLQRRLESGGLTHVEIDHVLAWHGLAIARRWRMGQEPQYDPWPPRAFGAVHLLQAYLSNGAHFVVWDGEKVFDPAQGMRSLDDYAHIEFTAAVVIAVDDLDAESEEVRRMLKEKDIDGVAAYLNRNNRERARRAVARIEALDG